MMGTLWTNMIWVKELHTICGHGNCKIRPRYRKGKPPKFFYACGERYYPKIKTK